MFFKVISCLKFIYFCYLDKKSKMSRLNLITIFLNILLFIGIVNCHGHLQDPPNRVQIKGGNSDQQLTSPDDAGASETRLYNMSM